MYKLTQHNPDKPVLISKEVAIKILNQEQVEFNGLVEYLANDDAVYERCAHIPGQYFKIEHINEEK